MAWAAIAARAVKAKQAYGVWKEARAEKKKEKAAEKAKKKTKKAEEKSEEKTEEAEEKSEEASPKKKGKAKRAFAWLRGKAPAAGAAAKGAGLAGVAVGGAAVGAGLAAGAAAYGGGRAAASGFWRLSRQLFMAINLLLLFSFILHWYDARTDFGLHQLRGFILILLAIYAWLFIYSKYGGGLGDLKAMIPPLLISAVAIILPIILLNVWVIKITHMKEIFTAVLVFAPVWPIVIMFGMPTTTVVKWVRVAYIFFIVIVFVPSAWYAVSSDLNIQTMNVGASRYMYDAGKGFVNGLKTTWIMIEKLPAEAKKAAQKQIQYAVGDYYTGEVEEGKNKPIGVYIENLKPVAMEFNADDVVVVWATLIARTLDPDKQIEVRATCWGQKLVEQELKKEQGDADPSSEKKEFVMTTTTEEEKYITCEFPPNFFQKGPNTVFVNAEFNFETMSYLKAYFMNLETLRAMKRSNIDPFDQYKITDKKPKSVCTNGPILLNMETSEPPVGVSTTEPVDIKLGITLENIWPQGKIKKVDDLMIKIPPALDIAYCDHAFEKAACTEDECEEGQYSHVYRIKKAKTGGRMGLESIKNVAGYHSITCRLKVNDMNRLMGNYPLISTYFKATANYVYELEKSTGVDIKEAIGGGTAAIQQTAKEKPVSFTYMPAETSLTVAKGRQKEFSVSITNNPGTISYGWKTEGVKEESFPGSLFYTFSSDTAGQAKVTFVAVTQNGTKVDERSWNIEVVEAAP